MLVTWNLREFYCRAELEDDPVALWAFVAKAPAGVAEILPFQSSDAAIESEIQIVLIESVPDKTAHTRQGFTYMECLVEVYGDARDQWRDDDPWRHSRFLERIVLALEFGFRSRKEHDNAIDIAN